MARVDGSSSGRQRVLACASRLLTDDRVFAVKLVTLVLPLTSLSSRPKKGFQFVRLQSWPSRCRLNYTQVKLLVLRKPARPVYYRPIFFRFVGLNSRSTILSHSERAPLRRKIQWKKKKKKKTPRRMILLHDTRFLVIESRFHTRLDSSLALRSSHVFANLRPSVRRWSAWPASLSFSSPDLLSILTTYGGSAGRIYWRELWPNI